MSLTEDRKVVPAPQKGLRKTPPATPWHQLCPFLASLGGRQSHWWRFGGFGVSGVPAWDDGREGALHDVQEQERGGPQRQPGEGKVSPI